MNFMNQQQQQQQQVSLLLRHRQLSHSSHSTTSERNIFLAINIMIVVVLLVCILGYCYFFRNRFDAIIRHQLELNDQALEQNIRDRQSERERALAAAQQQRNQDANIDATVNDNLIVIEDDDDDDNDASIERRRALLVESFQRNKVTMVVTEEDFSNEASEHITITDQEKFQEIREVSTPVGLGDDHVEPTNDDIKAEVSSSSDNSAALQRMNRVESLEEGEVRYLWIGGRNGTSSSTAQPSRRRVPNCCAICLGPYEVNETVVWSCSPSNSSTNIESNNGCNHAFHRDCMIDWLIKVRDGTPCPCCRQEFTDLPILPRRNKFRTTEQQLQSDRYRIFDPAVFSFR